MYLSVLFFISTDFILSLTIPVKRFRLVSIGLKK